MVTCEQLLIQYCRKSSSRKIVCADPLYVLTAQQVEYVVSAANTLSEEKKEDLTNASVQMKNDLSSGMSPAPFLLVLHQAQDVQEAQKLEEAAFMLTDSKETADQLTQDGFLQVAAIEVFGFYLFRKVRYCLVNSNICLTLENSITFVVNVMFKFNRRNRSRHRCYMVLGTLA